MFTFTSDYNENVNNLTSVLRVDENFDIIKREIRSKNNGTAALFYIDGFIKANELQKLLLFFINLPDFGCGGSNAALDFACDLIARTLFAPAELSISSVTAFFGAPVVIWMLLTRRREGEA